MEIGLLIRYGKIVPGRETEAVELFAEGEAFFTERLSKGEITFFEPFFLSTSDLEEDLGFHLIKGDAPAIFKLMEDETYRALMTKMTLVMEHPRVDLLTVGEGIPLQMERFAKVRVEIGM
ncbi:MAG TPA: hypothetical protein VE646_10435 [Actinomycetota bacterium]|jgi:hypothetical protein|nr:hypothetical protein [Actinomycetota bacterium]